MSVNILLITHEDIGAAFVKTAKNTYGQLPIPTQVLDISNNTDPEHVLSHLKKTLKHSAAETEFLILTDMYGATPFNIAMALQDFPNVRIICGLNLPMLIKVLNYPDDHLPELALKAMHAGQKGIINCAKKRKTPVGRKDKI